jgi:hypothetical protein
MFIEFDDFFKVIINEKLVVLTKQELTSNSRLFQIYLISLLLTEDIITVKKIMLNNSYIYGINSRWFSNDLTIQMDLEERVKFTIMTKLSNRNPLNASSPKRSSGPKKIRKFMKLIDKFYRSNNITDLSFIIPIFYRNELQPSIDYFERYIAHEKKIQMLSSIFHNYGRDIYVSVNKFL